MEVAPQASTTMGMAFTSWRMPMGKVYELHLRIHDQQGLYRRPNVCWRGKFAHGQISLIVRTNWGMEVTQEASTAHGNAFYMLEDVQGQGL